MKSENMREIPSSCIKKRWTCKEMCFYASQVDEGPQELSSFIATQTERMKSLYMKNKNNNGEYARTMNAETVRKFNSTCKKKNANTNAQNTRMSVDDEGDDASFNTFFTHDYMNSASQTPLHQNFTTNADYMSNDWHNSRNESQTFTFNNSVNAQNVSYDGWNIDMANKVKHVSFFTWSL
ncbi:hypothetical protein ACJIZ3_024158 [Penstemon smallii]|uniref:Uncharacterized protein n=1 Tax=Penstemon smallii TaxID=265156 RepID=A0ABD3TR14_9LAMI